MESVRPCGLSDLPGLRRSEPRGVRLDTVYGLVYGWGLTDRAFLSRLTFGWAGVPTYVLAREGRLVFGQIAFGHASERATLIAIAPAPSLIGSELWVGLLDGIVAIVGRRGARMIRAEVDDDETEAQDALREAGFAAYARQTIWRRESTEPPPVERPIAPRPAIRADAFDVGALFVNAVPRLVLQVEGLPENHKGGWVCRVGGRVAAYLTVHRGRRGVLIQPLIHPEMAGFAGSALAAILSRMRISNRMPVYCCVRSYQEWLLGDALESLGFVPWMSQVVMVKYTTVRARAGMVMPLETSGRVLAVPPVAE